MWQHIFCETIEICEEFYYTMYTDIALIMLQINKAGLLHASFKYLDFFFRYLIHNISKKHTFKSGYFV